MDAGVVENPVRLWLRVEGFALLAACCAAYAVIGGDWWLFAILFLAPDLAMLGYLAGPRLGALAYNAAHSTTGALALGVLGWAAWPGGIALALIWLAHIGFDRAVGYGLKYPQGFGFTHLGRVGREAR